MKIIASGRQTGKTTALIKESAVTHATILTHSVDEARRLIDVADKLGLEIPKPLTYYALENNRGFYTSIKNVLLDNVELYLEEIVKRNSITIDTITLNKTD